EQLAQWMEQRGLTTPVGQVVGYQRERLVARVTAGSGQSIADSTLTTLTYSSVESDEQKVFNGTDRFTLPYNGVYAAAGWVAFASTQIGRRFASIDVNGSHHASDERASGAISSASGDSTLCTLIVGKKGDVISRGVFQDSGGALNILGASLELVLLSV